MYQSTIEPLPSLGNVGDLWLTRHGIYVKCEDGYWSQWTRQRKYCFPPGEKARRLVWSRNAELKYLPLSAPEAHLWKTRDIRVPMSCIPESARTSPAVQMALQKQYSELTEDDIIVLLNTRCDSCRSRFDTSIAAPRNKARQDSTPQNESHQNLALQGEERNDISSGDEARKDVAPLDESRQDVSPRDRSRQDQASQDEVREEPSPYNEVRQDLESQDEALQDASPRNQSRQDPEPQDEARQDVSPHNEAHQDLASQDEEWRDVGSLDEARQNVSPHNEASQDSASPTPQDETYTFPASQDDECHDLAEYLQQADVQ
ncbi:hypothetical protein BDY19DRAFT_1069 [Irpex rosettiformis]|uniref:Uncharacterized protein n=1 Tax=Irpex rosettiformis TaxID=378272 RepID=A0ACB8UI33_9APHY|nr:hypothetical protein BDY19DRAFT_1069 [Irpex rosettiformis]